MAEKKPASAEVSAGKEKLNSEELEKKIEELEKQKDEYLGGWQRSRADLLNYKKEEMERIGQLINYAKEELILDILPIMDNFEVIEKKLPENLKKDDFVKGLMQIKIQFQDFLKSQGVEEIKSIGEKFDPNFHEAVGDVPSEASAKEGVEKKDPSSTAELTTGQSKESGIIGEEDKSSSSATESRLRDESGKESEALFDFAAARVFEEIQKGYKINGRLLRPAKVIVSLEKK